MKRWSITQSQKEEIVEAIGSRQVTMTELAQKYGTSIANISYHYRTITGKQIKPQNVLSQTDKETIVKELQARSSTQKELAVKFGVSVGPIQRAVKEITGGALYPDLSQTDRETIVADLVNGKAHVTDLAIKYNVHPDTIERTVKRQTGQTLTAIKNKSDLALWNSPYRAWHKNEKLFYSVLGVDWFHHKVLILQSSTPTWVDMTPFILMLRSGLKDSKRTSEHPGGQEIYVGDIIQFPINLEENGKVQVTVIEDIVAFNKDTGWFVVSKLDDPLCLHNDECEVIGTIYEQPQLSNDATDKVFEKIYTGQALAL